MLFQEPKVEFVALDLSATVVTASAGKCKTYTELDPTGGGQRCTGTQEDAKDCSDWDTSIPYSGE